MTARRKRKNFSTRLDKVFSVDDQALPPSQIYGNLFVGFYDKRTEFLFPGQLAGTRFAMYGDKLNGL